MTNFYYFIAGGFVVVTLQWVLLIPELRRHRLKMALLDRARVYLNRAKSCQSDQQALQYHHEVQELLKQVEAIK